MDWSTLINALLGFMSQNQLLTVVLSANCVTAFALYVVVVVLRRGRDDGRR